ncbi:unnamed protein product, partial [Phaeothamnion confervicola]
LLRRVAPVHRGALRRRTRFTRAWRSDGDSFEIRSNMLLLYKSRKSSSIGFLDSIFSKISDDGTGSGIAGGSSGGSGGTERENTTGHLHASGWDAVFDLSGAVIATAPHSEKDRTYPFKIVFGTSGGGSIDGGGGSSDKDVRSLHLCADSEQSRAKWVHCLERAAKCVSRADFELLRTIGRGQWGTVFLARKTGAAAAIGTVCGTLGGVSGGGDGGVVALKEVQLSPNTNISHVQNERLIMEAVPPHEFIMGMQFAFRSGRYLYYALDFMNGGDLFRHWRRHRDRRAEMAPFYVAEVLLALQHLHAHGVIYRDLKPENVLLDAQGHVKLADLGLAKILPRENGRTTSFCGTEAYLAPEMILRLPYNVSVDYWQFGCFLFELYAGRSPFWLPRKPRKFIRENILNGSFTFPTVVPDHARPLVTALLQVNDTQRIGYGGEGGAGWNDVRADVFFANMDWEALAHRRLTPPILPEDPGPDLVNNFDEDFTNLDVAYGVDDPAAAAAAGAGGPAGAAVPYDEELLGFAFVRHAAEA